MPALNRLPRDQRRGGLLEGHMRDDRWLDRAAERYRRSERRKWLKMLSGVGAYLLIAAVFGLWVLIGWLLYPERFAAKPQSKRRR